MYNHDYIKNAIELDDNTELSIKKDIYDYNYKRLHFIFEQTYNFCQENLSNTNSKHIFQPAKIYFGVSSEINASARRKWGYSLIKFNKGLVEEFHDLLYCRFGERKKESPESDFLQYEKNPQTTIMFQTAILFLFYHELGHLIQFGNNGSCEKEESTKINGSGIYSLDDHAMEIDADLYACSYLSDNIVEFIKTIPSGPKEENIKNSIIYSLNGIFLLFLMFNHGAGNIYFDRESHPHPYIRLSIIIDYILDSIESKLKMAEISVTKINKQIIVNEIGSICEARLEGYFEGNLPSNFKKIIQKNEINIKAYTNLLINKRNEHPHSTHNRLKV